MSLQVFLVGALCLVTAAQDIGIDSTAPTASRLLELEGKGEQFSTTNLSEVKDGLLVFLFNHDYRYSKLGRQVSSGDCNFDAGDVNKNQIWKLKEDATRKGLFFLVNFAASTGSTTYRYAFNPDAGGSFCFNGDKYDDQLWKFEKMSNGYWMIYNYAHSDCRLATWSIDYGGAYCGDAHDSKQWFRIVPAFDSKALWQNVDGWDNRSDQPVAHTFKYTEGISSSIKNTIAEQQGSEVSVSFGIEGAVEDIGLSASDTMTVSQSFTESFEKTSDHTWSIERTEQFSVPPGTRMCIKQLVVNCIDNHNGVGFVFSSALHRVEQGDACD